MSAGEQIHRDILANLLREGRLSFSAGEPRLVHGNPDIAVADGPTTSLVFDAEGALRAALSVSNPAFPLAVKTQVEGCLKARVELGVEDLGAVVLEPLATGAHMGCSFALWPAGRALPGHRLGHAVRKRLLAPDVLDWLLGVTIRTGHPVDDRRTLESYVRPLTFLAANTALSPALRAAAGRALHRISTGEWQPKAVLSHNDMWIGNLLLPMQDDALGAGSWPFLLIDWAGMEQEGHPFGDLLRFTQSVGLSRKETLQQIDRHRESLEEEWENITGYALAAAGAIAVNPGSLPPARVNALCATTFEYVSELEILAA